MITFDEDENEPLEEVQDDEETRVEMVGDGDMAMEVVEVNE